MAGVARRCYPHQTFSRTGLNGADAIQSGRIRPSFTRVFFQNLRDLNRVDAGGLPPCSLIAGAMNRMVMDTAERHSKLVAGSSTESPRLHVASTTTGRFVDGGRMADRA
jgi:hypothetical protein